MELNLTEDEKDTLSYVDVAFLLLKKENEKIKIQELFKKAIKEMDMPETEFTAGIGDFFECLLTDKRFIMLDNGYCDLRMNHSAKIVIDDEDDEFDIAPVDDESVSSEDDNDEHDEFDEEVADDDPEEDDLDDLVIVDDSEETDTD